MTKPRISKVDGSWSYTLPAFGFAPAVTKGGYTSREQAGKALAKVQNIGSGAQVVERAATPKNPYAYTRWYQ